MALKFFWRFEGTTLDGTHDFTGGDSTATTNGSASLSATAARVGTNGGLFPASGGHQFRFDTSTGIVDRLLGAVGFSFRVTTAPSGVQGILNISGSAGNNYVFEVVAGEMRVTTNLEGTGESSLITTAAGITTNLWYGILYRWDHVGNRRTIEVYNASNALIDSIVDNTAFTVPADLAASDGMRIGNTDGNDAVCHFDNLFIGDTYAEPIESNFTITSYTGYSGGGGSPTVSPQSRRFGPQGFVRTLINL